MKTPNQIPHFLFLFLLLLVLPPSHSEDDVKCLQGLKSALGDPQGRLNGWAFTNSTPGFICNLAGASCWTPNENRLIDLQLVDFNLTGEIPDSLQFCTSLQTLDLSGNSLSGSIPSQICTWVPFLVTLDLSDNQFSGHIPPDLGTCKYLNKLVLSNNRLSGSIPFELSNLDRLKDFSVSGNDLSGSIPTSLARFDVSSFDGNRGLCGHPIGSKCGGLSGKNLGVIIAAGVLGAFASLVFGLGLWWWYFSRVSKRRKEGYGLGSGDDGTWVDRLRAHKLSQVYLFQKPIRKVTLAHLLSATNYFSQDNVVISTRTGTTYKAVLPDGSGLAIKRLNPCNVSEKQFKTEMNHLGKLKHPNLVPLLGYCVVEDEKLLVYKHMSNGTLCSVLHEKTMALDWPVRFRICLGAAKGLAWLHHGVYPPCLHKNISSNVILLDEDIDARVIDFGLGDFGYIAHEHSRTVVTSLTSDVYAFGVVLFELLTGQKSLEVNGGDENLFDWVNQFLSSGRELEIIDKDIVGKGHDNDILKVLTIATKCVTSRPNDRLSMYHVYELLKDMNEDHFSELSDDFPLIFGQQEPENPV